MADVHNEDLIPDLYSALSKVREALDTTVKIEQDPGMSTSDRNSNVVIVKAAVTNAISVLQNCGSENFLGTASPAPSVTAFRIAVPSTVVAGSGSGTFTARIDTHDHNGVSISTNEEVLATWSSSDATVVSVNSSTGVYTPVSQGNITVTARYTDGSVSSAPMVVTV
tara:strand:+ start:54 stop:554 length:501 start_codon:yes stop_codon:yes gene_type:complete